MLIQTQEFEQRFDDTHLIKTQDLLDDIHPMMNYEIVLRNGIIDGADNVKICKIQKQCGEICFLFLKKVLDYQNYTLMVLTLTQTVMGEKVPKVRQ